MKIVKYLALILALVFFVIAASLENTTAQTVVIGLMFVFFQVWLRFSKNDCKHSGQ